VRYPLTSTARITWNTLSRLPPPDVSRIAGRADLDRLLDRPAWMDDPSEPIPLGRRG